MTVKAHEGLPKSGTGNSPRAPPVRDSVPRFQLCMQTCVCVWDIAWNVNEYKCDTEFNWSSGWCCLFLRLYKDVVSTADVYKWKIVRSGACCLLSCVYWWYGLFPAFSLRLMSPSGALGFVHIRWRRKTDRKDRVQSPLTPGTWGKPSKSWMSCAGDAAPRWMFLTG